MAEGDIGVVIDTGIFDAVRGMDPSIVHVSGDVFAVAYKGPDNDGWLCTFTIDNLGNIGGVINTLEFDNVDADVPCLIHVTGNIFAIAYWMTSLDDGIVKTFTISPAGVIGAVATLTFDAVRGRSPDIIHIFGDVYAIAYWGPGDDSTVCTITINNVGAIGFIAAQSYLWTNACGSPNIIHVFGNVFAIAYKNAGGGGTVNTVSITNLGAIGAAVLDTESYDAVWSENQRIIHISGDVYAIAYTYFQGGINRGKLCTLTINNLGVIGFPVIASLIFDAAQGIQPNIIHISRDVYAIAYRGPDDDGFLITLHIADNGTIGAIIDTLEFDTTAAGHPNLIHISGDVYAIAYSYMVGLGPGYVKTMDIQTSTIPTVQTDPATGVT